MDSRTTSDKPAQDQRLEAVMGNLLRLGVLLSAVIVLGGGILYLMQHGAQPEDYRHFSGEPARFTYIPDIFHTALAGQGRSIIQLGLLVLMATPILRIVVSIAGYVVERDWRYVLITLLALSIILFSLLHDYL